MMSFVWLCSLFVSFTIGGIFGVVLCKTRRIAPYVRRVEERPFPYETELKQMADCIKCSHNLFSRMRLNEPRMASDPRNMPTLSH